MATSMISARATRPLPRLLLAALLVAVPLAQIAQSGAPGLASAAAQELDLEQIEEARLLYSDGADQYKAGKFADAEKSFKRVYEIMHTVSVLFDIGLAQEKQRHWADAADSFDSFMAGSKKVNNRKRLEKRVVELRRRAARQAELANMANPKIRSQGKPGAPGNEVLESYKDEELALGSGEMAVPEAAVSPEQASATPAPAAPQAAPAAGTEEKKSRWWIWAIVGGAVAVGAGVGLGVGLAGQKPPTPTCDDCGLPALRPFGAP